MCPPSIQEWDSPCFLYRHTFHTSSVALVFLSVASRGSAPYGLILRVLCGRLLPVIPPSDLL